MSYFVVIRRAGPSWDEAKPMRQQAAWDAHATFMDTITDEGFVLLGGLLPRGEATPLRALVIANASNEADVRLRLDQDPWAPMGLLEIVSVEPWEILVGLERVKAWSENSP